jgi:protein-ribulosamine 3-kinase
MIDLERSVQGSDPEINALSSQILEKVVPRLLRPMETGGNKITPVLLHSDMWHGNVSVDNESDEPIIYDAGSFYGHNEYEMSPWRATRYRFNKTHLRAYHKLVPVSEPAEDHDDRNALYAL